MAGRLFTVIVTYSKPLEEVLSVADAHRAHLDGYLRKGVLLASGPLVPRTGGVIWLRDVEREQVEKMVGEDPYTKAGVATFQILEFDPVKRAQDFAVKP